jgi:hypothetical protein
MKPSRDKIMRKAERYLKRTAIYQEKKDLPADEQYSLHYVLKGHNKDNSEQLIAYAANMETMISFNPHNQDKEISYHEDWSYDIDSAIFDYLEDGYELVGMSLECHYNVWSNIEEWHDGDIEHLQGMQKYLDYCKRNSVTKVKLQKELSYLGMDVMKLHEKKERSHKEHER